MKDEILLKSRFGDTYKLKRIGENNSHLFSFSPNIDYIRYGIIDGDPYSYQFIDPPGGPFIVVGAIIDNKKVKSIKRDNNQIIIELDDLLSN